MGGFPGVFSEECGGNFRGNFAVGLEEFYGSEVGLRDVVGGHPIGGMHAGIPTAFIGLAGIQDVSILLLQGVLFWDKGDIFAEICVGYASGFRPLVEQESQNGNNAVFTLSVPEPIFDQ